MAKALFKIDPIFSQLIKRILYPLGMLVVALFGGALGYYIIGIKLGKEWSFLDCIYMTSITLTTVGYGEVFNASNFSIYKIYTIIIMWLGLGITLYAISTITAFVVEEETAHYFRRRKMLNKIAGLKGHYIICGAGRMGIYVIDEMFRTKNTFVVIEKSEDRINKILEDYPNLLYINADATEERTLKNAGIENAKGLIATLGTDSENLLITVTARYLNKNLRIVARCIDDNLVEKFKLSGADSVVSTNFIGGLRLASEMLRPTVVNFLDRMLKALDPSIRFEEVLVKEESSLVGKKISESQIRENTGLTIIAIKEASSGAFLYNPSKEYKIMPKDVLIVIGNADQISKLRHMAS